MASIWKLPVIFICENNLYGFSTPVSKVMNIKDVAQRAKSYGMDEIVVDGNDVVAVYDTVKKYIDFVRSGKGPVLIECKTYRHKGHSRFEPANYRTIEEVEEWKKKDPVKCFKNILKENYHQKEEDIKVLEENINAEIKSAIEYAKNSPGPVAEESLKYAYAN